MYLSFMALRNGQSFPISSGHSRYGSMKCNHPVRDIHKNKQFKVKACENGKTRLVRFGDAHMRNRSYELDIIVHRKKVNLLRDIGPVKNGKKEYKYCSVSL